MSFTGTVKSERLRGRRSSLAGLSGFVPELSVPPGTDLVYHLEYTPSQEGISKIISSPPVFAWP